MHLPIHSAVLSPNIDWSDFYLWKVFDFEVYLGDLDGEICQTSHLNIAIKFPFPQSPTNAL